jgi:hypothetical protein
VSQKHKAVTEKESRRVQQLRVQGREWSVSLVNCEDWVRIGTEEYKVIEDEIRSLRSALKR